MTLGNATTTSYGYTTQSALASLGHNLTGTAQDNTWSYTRNQAQEIAGHSWNNDLYQWAGYSNGTKSYTANGLNQYTAAAGATITHDANGNLTGDGVWSYTYDTDNRLKSANKTGLAATLAYDAEGRLRQTVIAGATTNLAYDGVDLVAEYDSAGTLLRRYVHGPGMDEPLVWYEGTGTANKNWLYADHLGSIVATANSAGASTATYTYGPYGEPNVTTGSRFRYTGQQLIGQLNLYYYKARFYSPAIGRFLQTDPIGTADDMNLYAYVGNNPINATDPMGLTSNPLGQANDENNEYRMVSESYFTGERINVAAGPALLLLLESISAAVTVNDVVNGDGVPGGTAGKIAAKSVEKAAHGNKIDGRAATLYEKYDKDGNFLKHGITKHENPVKRYTAKEIDGGTVVRTDRGPRSELIKKERDLVERSPGPQNREPWAGKRQGE